MTVWCAASVPGAVTTGWDAERSRKRRKKCRQRQEKSGLSVRFVLQTEVAMVANYPVFYTERAEAKDGALESTLVDCSSLHGCPRLSPAAIYYQEMAKHVRRVVTTSVPLPRRSAKQKAEPMAT